MVVLAFIFLGAFCLLIGLYGLLGALGYWSSPSISSDGYTYVAALFLFGCVVVFIYLNLYLTMFPILDALLGIHLSSVGLGVAIGWIIAFRTRLPKKGGGVDL